LQYILINSFITILCIIRIDNSPIKIPVRPTTNVIGEPIESKKFSAIDVEVPESVDMSVKSKINISDRCVDRLKKVTDYKKQFLRVEVLSGGCSGLQYKFDVSDQVNPDDRIFERDEVKVVIDETSLEYVNGSTVDYNEELIKSSFRIVDNPRSEQGCSCGASFSVKLDNNSFKF